MTKTRFAVLLSALSGLDRAKRGLEAFLTRLAESWALSAGFWR